MENTHRLNYTVNSYDVNPRGKARLTSIANFLQETAYKHAHTLELGYEHLKARNTAWILSRLRIKVLTYPNWDDEISIETWPRGIEKLFAIRDFRIFSAKGDLIAEAETCWLMVDMITHRPIRINPDFIKIDTRTDGVFESTIGKIKLPERLKKTNERRVLYSDLDIVGHVNNVKFIEWCIDSLDPELILKRGIADIEINYLSEAHIEEEVEIWSSQLIDNRIYITGRKSGSQKECFTASLQLSLIEG